MQVDGRCRELTSEGQHQRALFEELNTGKSQNKSHHPIQRGRAWGRVSTHL